MKCEAAEEQWRVAAMVQCWEPQEPWFHGSSWFLEEPWFWFLPQNLAWFWFLHPEHKHWEKEPRAGEKRKKKELRVLGSIPQPIG